MKKGKSSIIVIAVLAAAQKKAPVVVTRALEAGTRLSMLWVGRLVLAVCQ